MRLKILPLFIVAFSMLHAQSVDYRWYETDIFPYIISTGPKKGQGVADLAVDLIDKNLTGHSQNKIIMPSSRIQEELRGGAEALWPTAIRTPERDQFLYFSSPYVVINPLKFVSWMKSDIPAEIDSQFLYRNQNFRLAVVQGRSYGVLINQMLKDIPEQNLTFLESLKDDFTRVYNLLALERLTGFFAYEDEVNALCEELDISVDNFKFSNVKGLNYIVASIAAPRTRWGSEIIERINGIIDYIKKPVAMKYMQFLPPESRDEYLKISEEMLEY
jgi:uncharacterized protein (TIGR02285 family)